VQYCGTWKIPSIPSMLSSSWNESSIEHRAPGENCSRHRGFCLSQNRVALMTVRPPHSPHLRLYVYLFHFPAFPDTVLQSEGPGQHGITGRMSIALHQGPEAEREFCLAVSTIGIECWYGVVKLRLHELQELQLQHTDRL